MEVDARYEAEVDARNGEDDEDDVIEEYEEYEAEVKEEDAASHEPQLMLGDEDGEGEEEEDEEDEGMRS